MSVVKLGKFEAHGQQYSQLQINRTLSGNLADQVYLGALSNREGNHNLVLSVHDIVADEIVQYRIFTNSSVPQATWNELPPFGKHKKLDYNVLYRVDGDAVTIRMDRALRIPGKKEYRVKINNLQPTLEHYSNVKEEGFVPQPIPHGKDDPHILPPSPHPHPIPDKTEIEAELYRMWKALEKHFKSPAPHSGHEIVVRKNQPYGYAGLDEGGHILPSVIPPDYVNIGTLTIKIGEQEVVFDGKSNVTLDLSSDSEGGRIMVQDLTREITGNLTPDTAAIAQDVDELFDDDPNTPVIPDSDPAKPETYVDDDPGESNSDPEESNSDPGESNSDPEEANSDDLDDLFDNNHQP